MHACDIAEDVAIGIGFDRLPVTIAPKLPANRRSLLTQSMRTLLTSLGFTECLTFALCSAEDNAESLKRPLHPPFEPTPSYDPLEVTCSNSRDAAAATTTALTAAAAAAA